MQTGFWLVFVDCILYFNEFKETYSMKISTVEEWRQSAVKLSGFPLKDIDLIHIDWCDLLAEDEQEQEEQDNGESEHDEGNVIYLR